MSLLRYTQEEGIDYDKVFALVARIEAIGLFLAYASFKDFMVYQIDVKSAFLYGKIEEEVYQKKDDIFISQDKYVGEILKKFRFTKVKSASTPMETQKPLLKDEDGEEVDVHMYRSMIGSLMYLTSSRPEIMFTICACARYQVNPKVSHLYAVKRIFRLRKKPLLSLDILLPSIRFPCTVKMPPKRTSTFETPTMTQAAIQQLIADGIVVALEAQAATMANTNRNFERTLESVFSRSKCAKEDRVTFATNTLTDDALSWWNAYAKPIRIEQPNRII
ncbi:uncharacterized mitochondrial protein-like protein [Tanacetum coccineum]|uniref:Uncharacterized mitochondrial protein-like protein n=1 Tax=Tanacetum coccineum TaxID=301880 RepID=A0ABQ5IVY4_9ASTR